MTRNHDWDQARLKQVLPHRQAQGQDDKFIGEFDLRICAALEEAGDKVYEDAGSADERGEEQSVHVEYLLVARGIHGVGNEEQGADADGDSSGDAAGNAEGTMERGFAEAQDYQRNEFEQQ